MPEVVIYGYIIGAVAVWTFTMWAAVHLKEGVDLVVESTPKWSAA